MFCEKCGDTESLALDGECQNCLWISLYQLDTLIVDELGRPVWAKALAARYRREMQDGRRF